MKKTLLIILLCLTMTACAGLEQKKAGMAEDLDSPEKAALLKQRVSEYWTAFINKDYETTFALNDPFFRARSNKNAYIGKMGTVLYYRFEITDVKIEGNVARVKTRIVFSVPKAKVSQLEFKLPETTSETESLWIYVYDNWYREHRPDVTDEGTAEY
jgi:hypothetical protein